MASASVVAELGDELVSASPVGPFQRLFGRGTVGQHDPDQQTSDFRNSDWNQIRVPFFDGGNTARERITDNVA